MVIQQYQNAVEGQRELYNYMRQANERLEDKAVQLLQASSVMVGLVVAGSLVALDNLSTSAAISLAATGLLFIAISGATIAALWPATKTVPHKAVWENIFEKYIDVDEEQAYHQTLSNYVDATQEAEKRNAYLGWFVTGASICLAVQITTLAALVASSF